MNHDAHVGMKVTNMCNGYQYGGYSAVEEIPRPIGGNPDRVFVPRAWTIQGSGSDPACGVFYFVGVVDFGQNVTESNEQNNQYNFCYNVLQGIIPGITTLKDCEQYVLETAKSL